MTIEEMKQRKIELGLTNEMLAQEAGLPLSTVQKVFSGITKAPRKQTIDSLEKVLRKKEEGLKKRKFSYLDYVMTPSGMIAEPTPNYSALPSDYRHTIDEYYALPENVRVELIDGVFYDMGAPAKIHQKILGELHVLFYECADQHEMPCEVYLSPCDVRLDRDNYTMVQPDLLVICGEDDPHEIRVEGAPDLAVEILSPSSRAKDMVLKLYKYQRAGVREYWIVDPKYQTVTVHYFHGEEYEPKTYSFEEEIPVEISEGRCRIDFSRVLKKLKGYYES